MVTTVILSHLSSVYQFFFTSRITQDIQLHTLPVQDQFSTLQFYPQANTKPLDLPHNSEGAVEVREVTLLLKGSPVCPTGTMWAGKILDSQQQLSSMPTKPALLLRKLSTARRIRLKSLYSGAPCGHKLALIL